MDVHFGISCAAPEFGSNSPSRDARKFRRHDTVVCCQAANRRRPWSSTAKRPRYSARRVSAASRWSWFGVPTRARTRNWAETGNTSYPEGGLCGYSRG